MTAYLNDDNIKNNDNNKIDKEKIAVQFAQFETKDECIKFYLGQKTSQMIEAGTNLKVEKIEREVHEMTRLTGKVALLLVHYKNYPNHKIWENKNYMLAHYRQITRAFIKNKKRCCRNVLLTIPDDITTTRAYYNDQAGYIPNDQYQFRSIDDDDDDINYDTINQIAMKKAKFLRQQRKQKEKELELKRRQQQQAHKQENDNDDDGLFGNNVS